MHVTYCRYKAATSNPHMTRLGLPLISIRSFLCTQVLGISSFFCNIKYEFVDLCEFVIVSHFFSIAAVALTLNYVIGHC